MLVFGMGGGSEVEIGLERSGMWGSRLGVDRLCSRVGKAASPSRIHHAHPNLHSMGGVLQVGSTGEGPTCRCKLGLVLAMEPHFFSWAYPLAKLTRFLHGFWVPCIYIQQSALARASSNLPRVRPSALPFSCPPLLPIRNPSGR